MTVRVGVQGKNHFLAKSQHGGRERQNEVANAEKYVIRRHRFPVTDGRSGIQEKHESDGKLKTQPGINFGNAFLTRTIALKGDRVVFRIVPRAWIERNVLFAKKVSSSAVFLPKVIAE